MRLTTNSTTKEMNMLMLAFNCCYVKDGRARYRDYDIDIDARDFARKLMKKHTKLVLPKDLEEFDFAMCELLQYGTDTVEGLIALFYRNLWAMADLRECLKKLEDMQEDTIKLIDKNNGWIPCSERLPEDETDYLCCYEYTIIGGTHEGEKFKDYGVFYYNGYKWIKYWETINKKNIQVVAWQLLPEPYEEETEDE